MNRLDAYVNPMPMVTLDLGHETRYVPVAVCSAVRTGGAYGGFGYDAHLEGDHGAYGQGQHGYGDGLEPGLEDVDDFAFVDEEGAIRPPLAATRAVAPRRGGRLVAPRDWT